MVPNQKVTISFQVTVNTNTPNGTVISNQGLVDSDQTVPEPTDVDGIDANGDQPTTIPVGGSAPLDTGLYVEKVAAWSTNSKSDGAVTPGDTLTYTLVLTNRGDAELTDVTLTDSIPAGLSYVSSSAQTTEGTINVSGSALSLSIPSIPVGGFEFASFEVSIDALDTNDSPKTFTNQAVADSNQTGTVRSDSNGDPSDGNQPTSITAVSDWLDWRASARCPEALEPGSRPGR